MGNVSSFQQHFAENLAGVQNTVENGSTTGFMEDIRNIFIRNNAGNLLDRLTTGAGILETLANKSPTNLTVLSNLLKTHDCPELIITVLLKNLELVDTFCLIKISKLLNDEEREKLVIAWIEKNPKRGYKEETFSEETVKILCNDPILLKHLRLSKINVEDIFGIINDHKFRIDNPVQFIQRLDQRLFTSLEKDRSISRFVLAKTPEDFDELAEIKPLNQEILVSALYILPEHTNKFIALGLEITEDVICDLASEDLVIHLLYLYHFNLVTTHLDAIIKREIQLIDSKLCPYIKEIRDGPIPFKCSICFEDFTSRVVLSCPEKSESPALYCLQCASKLNFECATCKKTLCSCKTLITPVSSGDT